MSGNPLQFVCMLGRACVLAGALALLTGCGFKIAGPGETVSVAPLAGEDVSGACKFDINMPDQPNWTPDEATDPTKPPPPKQVAALVIYERGDSADLFNDAQV